MLAHVEHVLPRLGSPHAFDVTSRTSVGAIHAAFATATSQLTDAECARRLVELAKEIARVFKLDARDLLGIPLRSLRLLAK